MRRAPSPRCGVDLRVGIVFGGPNKADASPCSTLEGAEVSTGGKLCTPRRLERPICTFGIVLLYCIYFCDWLVQTDLGSARIGSVDRAIAWVRPKRHTCICIRCTLHRMTSINKPFPLRRTPKPSCSSNENPPASHAAAAAAAAAAHFFLPPDPPMPDTSRL